VGIPQGVERSYFLRVRSQKAQIAWQRTFKNLLLRPMFPVTWVIFGLAVQKRGSRRSERERQSANRHSSNGASGESGRIYMIGCVNQSVSHTSLKQWPSYSVSHQHRRGCLEEGVRKETLTPFTFLVDAFISSFASRRRRLFTLIPEHAYHHPSLPQYPHSSGSPGWTSCLLTQTTG
jgi:hypothetical protein